MILETARLRLRPFEAKDWADYLAYFNDAELLRDLGYRPFVSEEDFRGDFQWRLDNPRVLALVCKASGRVVGHVCVSEPDDWFLERPELQGKRAKGLSFALHRGQRRQGLMREALTAVLDALFDSGIDAVCSGYFTFNAASAALHRSLGFQELLRRTDDRRGESAETLLTRENWAENKRP